MRKVIALALALAIQAAAVTAPLVHAHPDDHATDHHGGRAIHSHWAGHAETAHHPDSPAVETEDHDRALSLGAFVAEAVSTWPAPAPIVASFALPVPAERRAHRRIEVVRSHDPPGVRSLPSRAPPACLS